MAHFDDKIRLTDAPLIIIIKNVSSLALELFVHKDNNVPVAVKFKCNYQKT